MDWSTKAVIVAGGLGGIGYATCNTLLSKGVKNLCVFDITENAGLLRKLEESAQNAKIRFWKVDATKKDQIESGFKSVLAEFHKIDVLINCVGVVDETHPERCIEINLLATVYLNYTAIDFMSKAKVGSGGIVVNIASSAGLKAFPLCVAYCATKHGVVGLTKALGNDFYFNSTGISFIAICPGFTVTPMLKTKLHSPIHDVQYLPKNLTHQSAEICGSLLVEAVEENKNGSIWMIEGGKMEEIIPPTYEIAGSKM